ncbi:Phytochrome-like protein cph1 [Burkholderiaceae bacterium]|nr:Phytochrome-like protein cph1 [Burkholderiaceae bacterium]
MSLPPLRAARTVAVAAATLGAAPAWAADSTAGGGVAAWAAAAFAVLVLLALGALLLQRERTLRRALQAERVRAQALSNLLDVWQWQSDREHRVTQLRPPQDAPSDAWAPAGSGELWTHFRCPGSAALRACAEAHAPIGDVVAELTLADGSVAACRLRATPLTDALGNFSGYVGTARVLGAAPAASSSSAPAPAPAPATPLETPHDNERESFSYTVSHDLRAPIRVVEGFTKILKEDYGRLLDRVGNDHLDRVLGAAARMNSMIDALLALSQLSTQPLARQPVNLSQLAHYIADDLRRQSPQRQVKFFIEPDLQVQGDPTLLRVVLENLLGNAWKYTGKCRDPQIWFGRDAQQPGPSFAVRDNGAGFDMRFADRLFGVFQRLHSATDFQGTGVGLASVRRIVRRHGGDIWAEAEVDRGASFHFTLADR